MQETATRKRRTMATTASKVPTTAAAAPLLRVLSLSMAIVSAHAQHPSPQQQLQTESGQANLAMPPKGEAGKQGNARTLFPIPTKDDGEAQQPVCYPGWDATCQDDPTFVSPLSLPCSGHQSFDCRMTGMIGFTEDEIYALVNACPCSCSIKCGTHTKDPTMAPTNSPTVSPQPTTMPTKYPTANPTSRPSHSPSASPTSSPTDDPSSNPTETVRTRLSLWRDEVTCKFVCGRTVIPIPSFLFSQQRFVFSLLTPFLIQPTMMPTMHPTMTPSLLPSRIPTKAPTDGPTPLASSSPSALPSSRPSQMPSQEPSHAPTNFHTASPSVSPSTAPSRAPTDGPTKLPSMSPSKTPTRSPSVSPTFAPTSSPSSSPSLSQHPSAPPTVSHPPTISWKPSSTSSHAPSSSPSSEPSRITMAQSAAPTPTFHVDEKWTALAKSSIGSLNNKEDGEESAPFLTTLHIIIIASVGGGMVLLLAIYCILSRSQRRRNSCGNDEDGGQKVLFMRSKTFADRFNEDDEENSYSSRHRHGSAGRRGRDNDDSTYSAGSYAKNNALPCDGGCGGLPRHNRTDGWGIQGLFCAAAPCAAAPPPTPGGDSSVKFRVAM